ncbi:MAG: hypothetical protein MHMPM18_000005 [Marteilia pararefringens]
MKEITKEEYYRQTFEYVADGNPQLNAVHLEEALRGCGMDPSQKFISSKISPTKLSFNLQEFTSMCKELAPKDLLATSNIDKLLSQIDFDDKSYLTSDELVNMLTTWGECFPTNIAKSIVKKLSKNSGDKIYFKDVKKQLEKIMNE